VPHVERPHRGRHLFSGPFPLGGRGVAALVAFLALVILLLLLVQDAKGNFVYWSNQSPGTTIGRAKINGTGANNGFIAGIDQPRGVAVDSRFIYWAEGGGGGNSIGRANLDGSGVNHQFITTGVSNPTGVAVTASGIYWENQVGMGGFSIGRANIDGSNPNPNFIPGPVQIGGLATDSSFVYFFGDTTHIGRATLDGTAVDRTFITIPDRFSGLAVDPTFIYWSRSGASAVGRVPVGGGTVDGTFVPSGTTGGGPCGVAVNSQFLFWGNQDALAIGRSNINGSSPNPTLVPGASSPCLLAAAPSNKVTINSVTRKKKKGTAIINAKVPGPGQVTLTNTGTEDVNAVAASVKQIGLTITGASSFKLAVKPVGKTKKKLKKQLKRKRTAKVAVKAFVTFVPVGVAGVPNSQPVKTKLIKQRKRKK
jgi:hypothetical protein